MHNHSLHSDQNLGLDHVLLWMRSEFVYQLDDEIHNYQKNIKFDIIKQQMKQNKIPLSSTRTEKKNNYMNHFSRLS